ncbi:metalloprotease, partial [Proteus mirabilis]|nr:metalloprotease [Proteus mirabilis]
NLDTSMLAHSGKQLFQAATLSDDDVKQLTNDACKEMDAKNKIAPANSNYTKHLNNIDKQLGNEFNANPLKYKVYLTK